MNRLQRLHDAGVSIWLDTLSRELLDSGAFAALIAGCAVTGATSNPTIFAKAITGSDRYDDQLAAAAGRATRGSCSSRSRSTTSAAPPTCCARLRRAAAARDGFVSFECTPDLADDTEATVEQALELWSRLARPNVMIKVPATEAGVPAIEELTARGVNVNVTLLFSVARYEQVIDAYIARPRAAGRAPASPSTRSRRSPRSSSRASTPRPTPSLPPGSPLRGRVAIANAHRAYGRYRARFADARWQRAASAPARDRSGRCGPAPGPRTRPTPTCSTSSELIAPGRHQHDAGGHPARLRRPRRRPAGRSAPTRGAARGSPSRRPARPASTSTRSPPSSSATACAPSATPTASCSRCIESVLQRATVRG